MALVVVFSRPSRATTRTALSMKTCRISCTSNCTPLSGNKRVLILSGKRKQNISTRRLICWFWRKSSWSSSLDGQTGIQSTIRNFTSNLLHIKKPWDSVLRGVHHSIQSPHPRRQNTGIPMFFVRMTQKFDCVFQNPTAFNFFILSRFKIREEWTYRSSVMVVVACPSTSESDLISNPTSTARVANV